MLVYSIIMFLVAALFTVFGISIYKGKTDLIHDYHQTKVTDKSAYGKDFGKADTGQWLLHSLDIAGWGSARP